MWIKFMTILLIFSTHYTGASTGTETYSGINDEPHGFLSSPLNFPGFSDAFIEQYKSYFKALQQLREAASMTYATEDANAFASASFSPSDNLFGQYQNAFRDLQQQAGNQYGYDGPSYASAYGSYGPNGIRQSTYINPPNPMSPNVNTRFASSGGPGRYYGVSSSSFSESSNINGQKSSRRGAITTVNDNGKISTYQSFS